jgi:hypothetical protein
MLCIWPELVKHKVNDSCSKLCSSLTLFPFFKKLKNKRMHAENILQNLLTDIPTPCHMKTCSKIFSIMK